MEKWKEAYAKLQNGSDIRGVALEGVEGEPVNLTPEAAKNIAMAFVDFLADKKAFLMIKSVWAWAMTPACPQRA